MAKRPKRTRISYAPPVIGEEPEPIEPIIEPKAVSTEQFREEYSYVIQDLRRVFILAAAMFALLIILNIVLR